MAGGRRHAPAALPPWKIRYPLYRGLSGPQGRSERVRKISPPPRFDPRTVQPVASLCMYVCMYVLCMCMYMYIYVYVCMYVCMYVCKHSAMNHITWTLKETWFRRPKQTLGPALGQVTLRLNSSWIWSCVVGWVIVDVSSTALPSSSGSSSP